MRNLVETIITVRPIPRGTARSSPTMNRRLSSTTVAKNESSARRHDRRQGRVILIRGRPAPKTNRCHNQTTGAENKSLNHLGPHSRTENSREFRISYSHVRAGAEQGPAAYQRDDLRTTILENSGRVAIASASSKPVTDHRYFVRKPESAASKPVTDRQYFVRKPASAALKPVTDVGAL